MKNSTMLWYQSPSADWNEALPIGNGRIGAMVFGNAENELIQLNEDSIWSGGLRNRNNHSAYENLEKVRQLLFDEKIAEAEEIVRDAFIGTPQNQRHYMPLGDMTIAQSGLGEISNYKRFLDIENATTITEYSSNGVDFQREALVSSPDNVMAIRVRASEKGKISLKIRVDGREDYYDNCIPHDQTTFVFDGGTGSADGIFFASAYTATNIGGRIRTYGSFLLAEDCDEVTIFLSCRTSYRHKSDFKQVAIADIEKAKKKSFSDIKKEHTADYQKYFKRAELTLEDNSNGNSQLPTNCRLEKVKEGQKDNKLIEMYFNFGRYLMISGSREGTLPMNLQGIWNPNMWPAWGCKFTININTEMNYWCAENGNLSDLHTPLFDHIELMRPNGRITAREMYRCGGFTCHHNTDIWGDTAPQDLWMPATQWPLGAAWLCLHIWEHYKFNGDKEFLSQKYETLKESAEFFVDYLIRDKMGRLVTCPSVSPENTYITKSGSQGCVCIGPSMDSQIIFELFTAVIKSSEILGIDSDFATKIKALREDLPKPEIGKYGQIKEWAEDYDEAEPGHRHISQLFALYPADQISLRSTPELARAARSTLERRLKYGGGHTGWSRAWIINLWARLGDSEKVGENIYALLSGSTYNNLFDSHPPFQIDGNFGGTAGIIEALLQSHNDEIQLIPSLPSDWGKGEFKNLKARGGFIVSASWENSQISTAEIISKNGGTLSLVQSIKWRVFVNEVEIEPEISGDVIIIRTKVGDVVRIKA